MSEDGETYLGDGVYASFDGWYVWLTAERDQGKERVALEPDVLEKLNDYAKRIWQY